jgi:hypothetical protein
MPPRRGEDFYFFLLSQNPIFLLAGRNKFTKLFNKSPLGRGAFGTDEVELKVEWVKGENSIFFENPLRHSALPECYLAGARIFTFSSCLKNPIFVLAGRNKFTKLFNKSPLRRGAFGSDEVELKVGWVFRGKFKILPKTHSVIRPCQNATSPGGRFLLFPLFKIPIFVLAGRNKFTKLFNKSPPGRGAFGSDEVELKVGWVFRCKFKILPKTHSVIRPCQNNTSPGPGFLLFPLVSKIPFSF